MVASLKVGAIVRLTQRHRSQGDGPVVVQQWRARIMSITGAVDAAGVPYLYVGWSRDAREQVTVAGAWGYFRYYLNLVPRDFGVVAIEEVS